jgi:hypothetical protein
MGRPKKPAERKLQSIEECNAAMADLLVAITDIEALTAERDLAVAASSAKFEAILDDAKVRRDAAEGALQRYYYAHLAELEKDGRKHYQLANGVMGRRDNPPALKPLNRNWTWAAIQAAVQDRWKGLKHFHERKAPPLDKESLKAEDAETLAKCGLKVESDETFYAEPARLPGGSE